MDNSFPNFSIVIPAYNNIELLKSALYSVLSQQNVSLELIVVDDSTNDQIEKLIHEIESPIIKYIHNVPSLGAVKNWNFGLSMAKGNYLILLHHDEFFTDGKHFLQTCLSQFQTGASDALILNSIVYFPDGNSRVQRIKEGFKKLIISKFPALLYSVNIIGPTACVVFKKNLLVPFNEALNWLVDVDWYYKLLKKMKIEINSDLKIGSFHGHAGQITNTMNIRNSEKHDQEILRKHFGFWSTVSTALMLRNCLYFIKRNFRIEKNPFWRTNENR